MTHPPRGSRLIRTATLGVAAVLFGVALGAPARAATVEIDVTGVPDTRGHVRVELCTQKTFLTQDCPYQGASPATAGATVVRIEAPPGVYAAQAFHDVTDQGVIHQNFLGVPRERVGFSNDAPVQMHGPRFKDAAFLVGGEVKRTTLRLRRFFTGGR
jgi:uncharacterized protein (DUF2141 family)